MNIRKVSKNDFDKISNLQLQLDYTKIKFDYTLKKVKIILNNKKSSPKEKIISEHIIYYCEMLKGNDSETDLTVGIFE